MYNFFHEWDENNKNYRNSCLKVMKKTQRLMVNKNGLQRKRARRSKSYTNKRSKKNECEYENKTKAFRLREKRVQVTYKWKMNKKKTRCTKRMEMGKISWKPSTFPSSAFPLESARNCLIHTDAYKMYVSHCAISPRRTFARAFYFTTYSSRCFGLPFSLSPLSFSLVHFVRIFFRLMPSVSARLHVSCSYTPLASMQRGFLHPVFAFLLYWAFASKWNFW